MTMALQRRDGERLLRLEVTDAKQTAEAEQPAETIHHAIALVPLSPLLLGAGAAGGYRGGGGGSASGSVGPGPKAGPSGSKIDVQRALSRLRRVAVSDVQVSVADGALGQSWQVSDASRRVAAATRWPRDRACDGQSGIGDVSAQLQAEGSYAADGLQLSLTTSPVSPAALAGPSRPWQR